jgi:phospholipid transport system substrate-binding protein
MAKKSSVIERLIPVVAVVAFSFAAPTSAQSFAGSAIVAAAAADIAAAIEARHAEFETEPLELYALVDDLILPHFDMARGCRAILAKYWDAASPAERDRFVEAFYNYLVASYGTALIYFNHDTLRVLPHDGNADTSPVRVKTVLTMYDGTEVDVDFVMVGAGDDWQVIDVVAEGVSYVKTYRSQFSVDIATDGLSNVLAWLTEKGARRFLSAGQ